MFSAAAGLLAQNESLLIGSGDLLHLQVYDTPEMEQRARVTDAGTIPFSFLGSVKVAGLTPAQAAAQIEQPADGCRYHAAPAGDGARGSLRDPERIGDGPGTEAGSYEIDTARKVVEVLAMAGGLTGHGGSPHYD